MKVLVTLVTVLAALGLTAGASAKELESAQICGADSCAAIDNQRVESFVVETGAPTPGAPQTAPYYRVEFTFSSGPDVNRFSHLFVPSANVMAAGGEGPNTIAWFRVRGAALRAIREAVADLEPYAAPAAWPTSIADPAFTGAERPAARSSDGRDWTPYAITIAGVLLAVAAAALVARRVRIRKPKPA